MKQSDLAPKGAEQNVTASHLRPVAGMMDKLGDMSFEELVSERGRLENARRGAGIGPDEWYRLHAIRALLTRYEVENLRNTGWAADPVA